jgi:hypothetical protein
MDDQPITSIHETAAPRLLAKVSVQERLQSLKQSARMLSKVIIQDRLQALTLQYELDRALRLRASNRQGC